MPYFHGSSDPLDIGISLNPGAEAGSTDAALDAIFETCRPTDKIPRNEAVYLVTDLENIDAVGGYTDHVYEVDPVGSVERSDLAWYSQAQCCLCDGDEDDTRSCAAAYWEGLPFHDPGQSVFEYRVRTAVVVRDITDVPISALAR